METFTYNPPDTPLEIIHVEDSFLLVNKPAGLLSVPGKSDDLSDCLQSRLWAEFGDTLLVHRLDMDTSGIMIFARKKSAQRDLNRQFENRSTDKRYVALVAGTLEGDSGVIDQPIQVDWPNRPLQKIDPDGKPAVTTWEVLDRSKSQTKVALYPKTGRSHQLRLHMQWLGHPILGDRFYGDANSAPRLCLHAEMLSFDHPLTQKRVTFTAPMPF